MKAAGEIKDGTPIIRNADKLDQAADLTGREVEGILSRRGQVFVGESSSVCECGEPISVERRLALPGVRDCIECGLDKQLLADAAKRAGRVYH